jgi:hypothetical protein
LPFSLPVTVSATPPELQTSPRLSQGSDATAAFRAAYENRYTWDPGFPGYRGTCVWEQGERRLQGTFEVGADLKARVDGIDDEAVQKAIAGQLWEVAIHRVRRPFEQTHGENTFTAGDSDEVGTEVIVGGKGAGDRYRIRENIVTMVHRHIHGTVVTIFTESTTDTGAGYLSHTYTSRYSDPVSGVSRGGISHFEDRFEPLGEGGPWVLGERSVRTEDGSDAGAANTVRYSFTDLVSLA